MNKCIIQLEGLNVFLVCLYSFALKECSWGLLLLLLFAPDVSLIGYVAGSKIGAIMYNTFHTYVLSLLITALSVYFHNEFFLSLGLIWTAHIAMDRFLGYGLKYTDETFKSTHVQKI